MRARASIEGPKTTGWTSEVAMEGFRVRLVGEREAAVARLERALVEARLLNDEGVGDELDRAMGAAEANRLFAAARKERALIREVDRALAKIARGEFGLCEGTGEPIEPRRLAAQPWARYSRDYLEQIEDDRRAA